MNMQPMATPYAHYGAYMGATPMWPTHVPPQQWPHDTWNKPNPSIPPPVQKWPEIESTTRYKGEKDKNDTQEWKDRERDRDREKKKSKSKKKDKEKTEEEEKTLDLDTR